MDKIKLLKLLTGMFAGLSLIGAAIIGQNTQASSATFVAMPLVGAMLCIAMIQKCKRDNEK